MLGQQTVGPQPSGSSKLEKASGAVWARRLRPPATAGDGACVLGSARAAAGPLRRRFDSLGRRRNAAAAPAGSDSQRSTADALKLLLNRACDRRRRVSCAGPGSERVAAEARPPQTPRRRGSAPLRAEMRVATLGLNRSVHHPCRAHRFILSGRCRAKAVGRSEISARARSCGGGRSVR
jgi:hypothetical protein